MDRSRREQEIFLQALEIASPGQRAAFVQRACAGDAILLEGVRGLLGRQSRMGHFLESPAVAISTHLTEGMRQEESASGVIGRYRLLEQIGEGGFGVVYMAEQVEPVHRQVALKIIKAGMDTKEVIARFEAERQALALMDHPNIARVFDAGATQTGRPYFVMELVRGIRITDYCDGHNLSTRERLDLFLQVCHAVQHAHQKGIIHRDLKPSNILVTTPDGVPVPKVIDFGIAKATAQRLTDKTLFTGFAQFLGTPAYISPEQAEITALDVDTRSDIYSLGVLLYELLTGQTPFDAEQLVQVGMDAMRRIIREEEPPRPSTRLSTLGGNALTEVAKHRHAEPPKLIHLVRGDLDWIVMKCLEKDRRRRYETANGLALDVERHLRAEPVQAVPPSLGYRIQKLAKRNRKSLGVAAVVLAAIMIAAASIGWVARDREARRAALEQKVAGQLDNVRVAYERDDLSDAHLALKNAEALLVNAAAGSPLAQSVRQWNTDLEMIEQLEEINDESLGAVGIHFLQQARDLGHQTDQAYQKTFASYGLPLEGLSDEALASKIRDSPIRKHLVTALDQWGMMRWSQDIDGAEAILGIAAQADRDVWRERIRAAMLTKSDQDLLRLARDPESIHSPPRFVLFFTDLLESAAHRDEAITYLRKAQVLHPDHFWINVRLTRLLFSDQKHGEGVEYGRAALALRPNSWWAHMELANNLFHTRLRYRKEETEQHLREVLRLNPKHSWGYVNLIETLLQEQRTWGDPVDIKEIDGLARQFLELERFDAYAFEHMAGFLLRHHLDYWDYVSGYYDAAIQRWEGNHGYWFQAAALHLHGHDRESYRRCCAGMLERFGEWDDAAIAERTAKTCLLAPGAVEDLQPVLKLSEFAVDGTEEHAGYPWFVMVRALAEYRAGHFQEAAQWLQRRLPQAEVELATSATIQAMSLHKLGRSEEAQRALARARNLIGRNALPRPRGDLYDWIRANILFREAAGLLGRQDDEATAAHKD